MKRLLPLVLLLFVNATASAQGPGFMLNISASGLVINELPDTLIAQIACTIVAEGPITLIILAEATGGGTDPTLALVQLTGSGDELVAENDDWTTLPTDQRNFITSVLRTPNGNRDAALVGLAEPGAYCAYAFQDDDASSTVGSISLQLTDVSTAGKTGGRIPPLAPIDDPRLEAMIEQAQQGLRALQP